MEKERKRQNETFVDILPFQMFFLWMDFEYRFQVFFHNISRHFYDDDKCDGKNY